MSEVDVPEQPGEITQQESPPAPVREKGGLYALQSLAGTIVIAVFVITFVLQAFQIPSESMEKTLLVGDYLLVDKSHYGHSDFWNRLMPYRSIRRQDIIVFRYPINPHQHFVKRVIAIPGDRIRLVDKHVYVNGVRQDDAYATFNPGWPNPYRDNFPAVHFQGDRNSDTGKWFGEVEKLTENDQLIVPENCYFVLGDNRDDSYDSRYWGFVPRENIEGRPLVIYWSMDRPDAVMSPAPPSGKLANLTFNVTQLLDSLRWHRMLRIPQ
jgi:signal peptidase I